ncbi:MAG: glycosyltransferase family 2 protein [Flavobacteriaceae bacterium]|nr:glycosyltransferase family 2 protein [Flavobacteriaceae bacterium]
MRISLVIPAHNESPYLKACLDSIVAQTRLPDEVIVVDDSSTDRTFDIASNYAEKQAFIKVFKHESRPGHLPGTKVVSAFNFGLSKTQDHELIGKFDADIVLPPDYIENMEAAFQSDWKLGICGGLLFVANGADWTYERIADANHVRGPIKLYHKACFEKIGGLRMGTGWDTVDVLLARYHDFHVKTIKSLRVKHLRPTGHGYTKQNHRAKGIALYQMRYGLILAKLALLKMAWQSKNLKLYVYGIFGYLGALASRKTRFVTRSEGRFIRSLRWKGIRDKLV